MKEQLNVFYYSYLEYSWLNRSCEESLQACSRVRHLFDFCYKLSISQLLFFDIHLNTCIGVKRNDNYRLPLC
jgi:hypothetical protein